ncbi:hypothetical protein DFS34DRAFT_626686, partial [Phlyctochytrium arcticum]
MRIVRINHPLVLSLGLLALSLSAGYSRDIGDHERERYLFRAVYMLYTVDAGLLCILIAVYSPELIRTLVNAYTTVKKDLMSTLGGASSEFGTIDGQSPEFKKVYGERDTRMQKAIFKIFCVAYTIIFGYFVIILTIFSFKYEVMFATLWWSKLQAFGTNLGVILIVLAGMVSLAWGETVRTQQKAPPLKTARAKSAECLSSAKLTS